MNCSDALSTCNSWISSCVPVASSVQTSHSLGWSSSAYRTCQRRGQSFTRCSICWRRPELVLETERVRGTDVIWYKLFRPSPGIRWEAVHSFIRCELMCDEQNLECVLRDLVTENADLQSRNQTKDRKLAEAQQQLREIVNFQLFIQALQFHCFFWLAGGTDGEWCWDPFQITEREGECRIYFSHTLHIFDCRRNSCNPVRGRRWQSNNSWWRQRRLSGESSSNWKKRWLVCEVCAQCVVCN